MLLMTRIARTVLVPVLAALTWPAMADAQLTKAGVVTTLQGTATVARAAASQPMPLKFKDTVFVQDRITTGNDSVARILLGGKAIVTVRERSVLTITEVPGTSTIELGIGKIALAIVKERMRPGETIEIRTPNAVAGIRGTVVITEVEQKTAQLGAGAGAFTSRFTVLQGVVAVSQYNPLTRQLGPTVNLGALQTTGITGSAPPRPPQTLTPEAARQLASEYKTTIKEAPAAANAALTNAQVQQAVSHVGSVLGPRQEPQNTEGARGRSDEGTVSGGVSSSGAATTGGPPSGGGPSGGTGSSSGGGVSAGGGGLSTGGGASSGGGPSKGSASLSVGGASSGGGGGPSIGAGLSSGGGGLSGAGGGLSSGGGASSAGGGLSGGGGSLSKGGGLSGGLSGGGGGVSTSGGLSSSGGSVSGLGGGLPKGGGLSTGGGIPGGGNITGSVNTRPKLTGDDLKKHSESKGKTKK